MKKEQQCTNWQISDVDKKRVSKAEINCIKISDVQASPGLYVNWVRNKLNCFPKTLENVYFQANLKSKFEPTYLSGYFDPPQWSDSIQLITHPGPLVFSAFGWRSSGSKSQVGKWKGRGLHSSVSCICYIVFSRSTTQDYVGTERRME